MCQHVALEMASTSSFESGDVIESPRAFLHKRHPGYFSDSASSAEPSLDRTLLEYQLSTLTSRSQETDFEEFARRLAEAEICPNLLPHTGPTGGGDSKVDSETYPVSDQLALAWYVGDGRKASRERWAFAFSAKKDWRSKVTSDIAKIAATGRGYAKAYFITSQFVPDKARSEVEGKLSAAHKLDVRILDRTWILDRVFQGSHQALAVEQLHMDVGLRRSVRLGPMDASRQQRLADLEDRVLEGVRQSRFGPGLVDDAIEAARLSRELERPRQETDGRFDRAAELSEKFGFRQQGMEVAYQKAWTAYWWFEDYELFAQLIERYEVLAKGTDNVYDIERQANLYSCVATAVRMGWLQRRRPWLATRARRLRAQLDRFEKTETAPSASLTAYALRLMLRLTTEAGSDDSLFSEMADVVKRAEGLLGFDLDVLAMILTEIAPSFAESERFESLYDDLVSAVQRRTGEVAAAELIVQRAVNLHKSSKYGDAIAVGGRALPLLYKEQSREQLVRVLGVIGEAYANLGLLWAARGSWLLATSVVGSDWHATGYGLPMLAAAIERIRWIELELGRLPQSLAFHRLYLTVKHALTAGNPEEAEAYEERDQDFDVLVGHALLNLDEFALRALSRAPDALDSLELFRSSAALLYALGRTEALPAEMLNAFDDLDGYLASWRDMSPDLRVDESALVPRRTKLVLTSNVLGMRVAVEHERGSPAVEIAESLLAALEGLLATGLAHGVGAVEPSTTIVVRSNDFAAWPFRFEHRETFGVPEWEVVFKPFNAAALSYAQQSEMKEAIRNALVEILARCFHLPTDSKEMAQRLFGEERALDRSLNFTGSFVVAGNVLGKDSATGLDALYTGSEREFRYSREKAFSTMPRIVRAPKVTGRVPVDAYNLNNAPHSQMRLASVIHLPMWDRAGWFGIGYIVLPDRLPLLVLLFKDPGAAADIWAGWQHEFGEVDTAEEIRVSFVRHVDPDAPQNYKVVIAPRLDSEADGERGLVFTLARIHEMTPDSDANLSAFLMAHQAVGDYYLGIGHLPAGEADIRKAKIFGAIRKKTLVVVEAEAVGPHDPEWAAIEARNPKL
jgi:hypothetical protein